MFKIIIMVVLGYFFYRLFLVPRTLKGPDRSNIENQDSNDEGEFVDYEEVD